MEVISTFLIVVLTSLVVAVAIVAWIWHALRQSQEDYLARLDRQEGEIDDLKRQVHELHMERIADRAYMQRWIEHGRQGWQKWSELSGQPPPPEPDEGQRPRPLGQNDLGRLAQMIANRFTAEEIDGLAFDLDLGALMEGETPKARARALVDAAKRRGLILRLIDLCRAQNPAGEF